MEQVGAAAGIPFETVANVYLCSVFVSLSMMRARSDEQRQ